MSIPVNSELMSAEQRAVVEAAQAYYWHNDESVDFHNNLMEAVEALEACVSFDEALVSAPETTGLVLG